MEKFRKKHSFVSQRVISSWKKRSRLAAFCFIALCFIAPVNFATSPDSNKVEEILALALELSDSSNNDSGIAVLTEFLESHQYMKIKSDSTLALITHRLGALYHRTGNLQTADSLYQISMAIKILVFGKNSAEYAKTLNNMGMIAGQKGNTILEDSIYQVALSIYIKAVGENSEEVADVLDDLARVAGRHERNADVRNYSERSLKIREKLFGSDDLKLVDNLWLMGNTFWSRSDFHGALPYFERILKIRRLHLDKSDPRVIRVLLLVGRVHKGLMNFDTADSMFKRAEKVAENFDKANYFILQEAILQQAWLAQDRSNYLLADSILNRALYVANGRQEPDSIEIAKIMHSQLWNFYNMEKFDELEAHSESTLKVMERLLSSRNWENYKSTIQEIEDMYPDAIEITASALIQLKKPEAAMAMFGKAIEVYQKNTAPRSPLVADKIAGFAYDIAEEGFLSEAESLATLALEIDLEYFGPAHVEIADGLETLASIAVEKGDFAKSDSFYNEALLILGSLESSNIVKQVTRSVYWSWARASQVFANFDRAESHLLKALELSIEIGGNESSLYFSTINGLALLYEETGNFKKAEEYAIKALSNAKKGTLNWYILSDNLEFILARQGHYVRAERQMRENLDQIIRLKNPNSRTCIAAKNRLAIVLGGVGRNLEALDLYKQVLKQKQFIYGNMDARLISSYMNLGAGLVQLEQYQESESYFKTALKLITAQYGHQHPDNAIALSNLSLVLSKQNKLDDAIAMQIQSSQLFAKSFGSNHFRHARSLQKLSQLYYQDESYDEALSSIDQAIDIFEHSLISVKSLGNCRVLESKILRAKGNNKESVIAATKSLEAFQELGITNLAGVSDANALSFLDGWRSALDNYLTSALSDEAINGSSIPKIVNSIISFKGVATNAAVARLKWALGETDSSVVKLVDSIKAIKTYLANNSLKSKYANNRPMQYIFDSLSNLANSLQNRLALHFASSESNDFLNFNVNAELLNSAVPPGTAVIDYLSYRHGATNQGSGTVRYVAMLWRHNYSPLLFPLGEASSIDSQVSSYCQEMGRVARLRRIPSQSDVELYRRPASELYKRVYAPLAVYIEENDLVIISPDRALNSISFASLVDDNGSYLIESNSFHYLSSVGDLMRSNQQVNERNAGLLAFGNPDFNASSSDRLKTRDPALLASTDSVHINFQRNLRSGCIDLNSVQLSPLPYSLQEVSTIVKLWETNENEPATLFLGASASEENFKLTAPGKRIIHLSTHGYYFEGHCKSSGHSTSLEANKRLDGENPLLLTGLFLAGANLGGESNANDAEDGILSAYEVSSINLQGTEMIVLSACETGLGEVRDGEGVNGLRRAFQIAGAKTIISALWPVSDKVTASMMSKLYENTDETLPEKLQRIQIERLNYLRNEELADHPFTWGAFIALGDWR